MYTGGSASDPLKTEDPKSYDSLKAACQVPSSSWDGCRVEAKAANSLQTSRQPHRVQGDDSHRRRADVIKRQEVCFVCCDYMDNGDMRTDARSKSSPFVKPRQMHSRSECHTLHVAGLRPAGCRHAAAAERRCWRPVHLSRLAQLQMQLPVAAWLSHRLGLACPLVPPRQRKH